MTVCYLDVDDEITDAVARLRTASDRRFIFVLPPGSRISTSRINLRLLAREAQERGAVIGVVAGEPGVRALAIGAGMPAFGTVDEAESALGEGAPESAGSPASGEAGISSADPIAPIPPPGSDTTTPPTVDSPPIVSGLRPTVPARPTEPMVDAARRAAGRDPGSDRDLEATRIMPRSGASIRPSERATARPGAGVPGAKRGGAPAASGAIPAERWSDPWSVDPPTPRARSRRKGRGAGGWLVPGVVLAALLGGAAYAAFLFLPNVAVSVTPLGQPVGPITVEITADPATAINEPDRWVVPAERIDVPLSVTDRFPATGTEVTLTRATGTVRFTSENTLFEVPVPEGTRVQTPGGVIFETTSSATIPRASFQSGPSTAQAPVRAVEGGPSGNVPAGAITRLPQPITAQLVRVTNPQATEGGQRTETLVVTRADYDAALAALEDQLDLRLADALADPDNTPRGLRAFPETAVRERSSVEPAAGDLVDQAFEEFALSAESRGTLLAVDESAVAAMAADRLEATLPPGMRLFAGSIVTSLGDPEVGDDGIRYAVEASGEGHEPLDPAAMVSAIRGRTVSEARAILAEYGSVQITPWPDFIDTVPDDARRIDLTILEPQRRSP